MTPKTARLHLQMQPTAAAAARQAAARASVTNAARAAPAAGAAGRLVAAPSRRPSTVAATPQARLVSGLIPEL